MPGYGEYPKDAVVRVSDRRGRPCIQASVSQKPRVTRHYAVPLAVGVFDKATTSPFSIIVRYLSKESPTTGGAVCVWNRGLVQINRALGVGQSSQQGVGSRLQLEPPSPETTEPQAGATNDVPRVKFRISEM